MPARDERMQTSGLAGTLLPDLTQVRIDEVKQVCCTFFKIIGVKLLRVKKRDMALDGAAVCLQSLELGCQPQFFTLQAITREKAMRAVVRVPAEIRGDDQSRCGQYDPQSAFSDSMTVRQGASLWQADRKWRIMDAPPFAPTMRSSAESLLNRAPPQAGLARVAPVMRASIQSSEMRPGPIISTRISNANQLACNQKKPSG